MKLYLSHHRELHVILLVRPGRRLIESDWHLILVWALLLSVLPFVLRVVSCCFPQSWLLRVSSHLFWGPIFIYQAWLSFPSPGFKECVSFESKVLMTSLSLYSFFPPQEWTSIFIIKGSKEARFTFQPVVQNTNISWHEGCW